ncbi:unnamed protein product, partial [marine sediment metagenome]
TVDLRYVLGLTAIEEGARFETKNGVISLLAGYSF